jgi:hypothetical protein
VKAAYRLAPEATALKTGLTAEMLETAQWALSLDVTQSLTQMAARGAAANPELGSLARERQDLVLEWRAGPLDRRGCPELAPTVSFSSRKNCFGYERKSSRPLPNRSSKIGRSLSPEQATFGGTFSRKAMLFCGSKLPHLSVNSLFLFWC